MQISPKSEQDADATGRIEMSLGVPIQTGYWDDNPHIPKRGCDKSWKYNEDNMTTGKNGNVTVLANVTTGTRWKFLYLLDALGESVVLWYKICDPH